MKKLVLLVALLVSTLTFAQTETKESKLQPYVALNLSIGDTDGGTFGSTSYASAEFGVTHENLSFGAILGRNNLMNIGDNESFNNYFYQGKVAASTSLGYVDGYALVGLGSYFEAGGIFTEYGVGISKEISDRFGAFIQVSNWDGTTYVTPGISYSL